MPSPADESENWNDAPDAVPSDSLRALFDLIPYGAFVADSQTRILEVNPALCRLADSSADELTQLFLADLLQSSIHDWSGELQRQGCFEGEFPFLSRQGRSGWWSVRVIRQSDERLLGFVNDITAQKQEAAKFRSLIEGARDMIFRMSIPDGRYEYVSPSAEQVIGYRPEELLASPLLIRRVIHPDYREFFEREWARMLCGEIEPYIEYCTLDPRGNEVWISQSSVGIYDASGRIVAVEGICRNVTEQKRAEVALSASKARLRAILDSTPECVKIVDADCRLIEVNCAGLAMFEAESIDVLVGQDISTGVLPKYLAAYRQSIAEASAGRPTRLEFEAVSLRGTHFWLEQNAVGLADPAQPGGPLQVLSVTRDITERKRTEAALRESEEHLRILVEYAPAGVAMLDRELRYLAHSRRWLTDYNLGEQNLIGRSHYEVFPGIPERWKIIHQRCLSGVSEKCEEDALMRADGSVIYLRWEIQPWRNAEGTIGGLVFFTELITERVLAQRALRESQERLTEAQEIAHLGNWNWDCTTNALTWSDEVYRIFGHSPQSFVPRYESAFLEAVHPDNRDAVRQQVENSLRTGAPYRLEFRILRPDRSVRIVRDHGRVVRDQRDSETNAPRGVVRMFGSVQDVTDLKQAEEHAMRLREELAQASRVNMFGELTAGIAHELNQPLSAMANYAFAIRSRLQQLASDLPDPQLDQCLLVAHGLENQAVRGGDIIRKLQGLIRGRRSEHIPMSVLGLVSEVTGLLSAELHSAQIELDLSIPDDLPRVVVDSLQIQQVLLNLCRNAIEAQLDWQGDKRLSISARADDSSKVILSVRDWGPGIPTEVQDQLFTPFVTTKHNGMGFGLAISRRIVEAHDGKLWYSKEVTSGAEFCCSLPTAASYKYSNT